MKMVTIAIVAALGLATGCDRTATSGSALDAGNSQCQKPWLFFDLGNTIVATPLDKPAADPTSDIERIYWTRYRHDHIMRDALWYLEDLKSKGYPIGLLVNIPESWGDEDGSLVQSMESDPNPISRAHKEANLSRLKVAAISDYFLGHGPGDPPGQGGRWRDPNHAEGMNWGVFPAGNTLVPFHNRNRKPRNLPFTEDSLYLFRKGVQMAAAQGCPAVYLGEEKAEMAAARAAGMKPFHVEFDETAAVQPEGQPDKYFVQPDEFFLEESKIAEFVTH